MSFLRLNSNLNYFLPYERPMKGKHLSYSIIVPLTRSLLVLRNGWLRDRTASESSLSAHSYDSHEWLWNSINIKSMTNWEISHSIKIILLRLWLHSTLVELITHFILVYHQKHSKNIFKLTINFLIDPSLHVLKGSHAIESSPLSKWCSLVPIGSASCVTTTGFRWNLNRQVLSFGSLISTSNEFDKNEKKCRIETDSPLLFSMDISGLRFWSRDSLHLTPEEAKPYLNDEFESHSNLSFYLVVISN